MTASTTTTGLWLTLRAQDPRALIRFLVDAFGFVEVVVHGDGDRVDHAELVWPHGGGVMLGGVRPTDADDPLAQPRPGAAGAYVVTDDTDALHARAVAAGAEVLRAPFDTDYGSRDATYRDPEGNVWSFGTYAGEPLPRT